jgi:hypothetical protein
MIPIVNTVYKGTGTLVSDSIYADKLSSNKMNLLTNLLDLSSVLPVYSGKFGYNKLVRLFLRGFTHKDKSVIHSSSVIEMKKLASKLVSSGKLAAVHFEFRGRLKGEDRKSIMIDRYDNSRVDQVSVKEFKFTVSRSKYGMIGGTMKVKAPFNLHDVQYSLCVLLRSTT